MDDADLNRNDKKWRKIISCAGLLSLVWLLLTCLSVASIIITLLHTSELPDFSDPHKGFETRGTVLASRASAFDNLEKASRTSGFLTSNPEGRRLLLQGRLHRDNLSAWLKVPLRTLGIAEDDDSITRVHTHVVMVNPNATKNYPSSSIPSHLPYPDFNEDPLAIPSNPSEGSNIRGIVNEGPRPVAKSIETFKDIFKTSDVAIPSSSEGTGIIGEIKTTTEDDDKPQSIDNVGSITSADYEDDHNHTHHNHDCSQPTLDHARLVISHEHETRDMWSLEVVHELCQLGKELEPLYAEVCETQTLGQCCPSWSLPGYLALAVNRTDCHNITQDDMNHVRQLLEFCAPYFHNLELECVQGEGPCEFAPDKCTRGDIMRSLMNFVLDTKFLPPNAHKAGTLRYVQSILPIARSTRSLNFYERMQRIDPKRFHHIKIIAMDLGLKNFVFDSLLVRDSIRVGLVSALVVAMLLLATVHCTALVLLGLINLLLSLGISYWLYCSILGAQRFPFLNVVAVLLLLAVGTDDVLFIAQGWGERCDKRLKDKLQGLSALWLSVTATSITTAAAMFVARFSSVTSIALFGIFAGSTMLIHLLMTLFWVLPSLFISDKISSHCKLQAALRASMRMPAPMANCLNRADTFLKSWFLWLVSRLSFICLLLMVIAACCASYVLFMSPRLQAPDSKSFALFRTDHPFERYESEFSESFWFERHQHSSRDILSLNWVWGIKPVDSRDFLDPMAQANASALVFDSSFDITKPKAQVFLLRFCKQLKRQAFYKTTLGPLLPNCFLESLTNYMSRRCFDPIDNIDRKPCCESSKFPYSPRTFTKCLQHAMRDFHNTPTQFYMPGVAGPWFDTRVNLSSLSAPSAIVIQFDSSRHFSLSHNTMEIFFQEVEKWTKKMLRSAPRSMKNGYFTSELQFYDLQDHLMTESLTSVIITAGIASLILYIVTRNIIITMLAVICVYTSVTCSLAILALLKWHLNVLESLVVTMASGLSIDFILHYAIKYNAHLERELRIKYLIYKNLGPICIATLTTLLTGVILLSSDILAFNQIGIFMIILISNSFIFSNFGYLSLLYRFGPSFKTDLEFCRRMFAVNELQDETNITSQAPLSDSNSVSLMPPLSPELEMENMSPTFLEDQSRPAIFDTPAVSSETGESSSRETKPQELAILEPLLQQHI